MAIAPLEPIGIFRCAAEYPYDAARQPALNADNFGYVLLNSGRNFEQAVQDLDGFSQIWLLYLFDRNPNWKPMVLPPRGERKVGVFATRAPYRPNPIGLSCVRLLRVEGLHVQVQGHDLLDGTPILDIKPYLAYADSVPDATNGWLDDAVLTQWEVRFSPEVEQQLAWLKKNGAGCLRAFAVQQLSENPFDAKRKRVVPLDAHTWEIAYRTWRLTWRADELGGGIDVIRVRSGYSNTELQDPADPYGDKPIHRAYLTRFEA